MEYCALIIDVVGSRDYLKDDLLSNSHKRQEIQNFLMLCVDFLNYSFESTIKKKLVFSGGDEIQGLFNDPNSAFLCYRLLTILAHPVKLRGGMAIGAWNVQMDDGGSASQDGVVYYDARQAIDDAKKTKFNLLVFHEKCEAMREINAATSASIQFCVKRTSVQNDVALFGELLCPICKKEAFLLDDSHRLLQKKASYNAVIQDNQSKQKSMWDFTSEQFVDAYWQVQSTGQRDSKHDSPCYYINEGKISGLAKTLSPLLQKSRQSLEKTIKHANITIERNVAIAGLELMSKSFDAPRWQSWS